MPERWVRSGPVECRRRSHVLLAVFLVLFPLVTWAQVHRDTASPTKPIRQFEDARDLAADDRGTIYVLDGVAATITIISSEGMEQQALSAAGAASDGFSDPVDLDPTNGLTLIVADAGRGELQWYSRSFRVLETRPLIASTTRQGRQSPYGASEDALVGTGGRPIAVTSTERDEVFAIDENDGIIFRWDASGRFSDTIGREGRGRLVEPVDLTVADDLLFAADAQLRAIMVYDRFGSFLRRIRGDMDGRIQAISSAGSHLCVTLPGAVVVFTAGGRVVGRYRVELDEPLIDCVRANDALYLLTQSELYQLPTE